MSNTALLQTATVILTFDDGSQETITLDKCLVVGTKNEALEIRKSREGWLMVITEGLLRGRKLAKHFLSIRKDGIEVTPDHPGLIKAMEATHE